MKYIALLLPIGIIFSGCGSEKLNVAENVPVAIDSPSSEPIDGIDLDVGDVEHGVHLELTPREGEFPAGATVEEMQTVTKRLTLMTVDIEGPAPASLPLTFAIKTRVDFGVTPVALRGNIYREIETGKKEIILTFNSLVDETALGRPGGATPRFPFEFKTDAMVGLSEVPSTMLLVVEAEAVLLDATVDKSTVDPATVKGGVESATTLLSNPIRINYKAAAISETPTATEAAPSKDTTEIVEAPSAALDETTSTEAPVETPAAE